MIKMKNYSRHFLLVFGLCAALVACESNENKAEEAFEQVRDSMTAKGDSTAYADSNVELPKQKAKPAITHVVLSEEARFAKETEATINSNEVLIKELKGTPDNAKLLKKISQVEKDNAALRLEMAAYLAEVKLRWETHKATTLEELSKIEAELKTLKEGLPK